MSGVILPKFNYGELNTFRGHQTSVSRLQGQFLRLPRTRDVSEGFHAIARLSFSEMLLSPQSSSLLLDRPEIAGTRADDRTGNQ